MLRCCERLAMITMFVPVPHSAVWTLLCPLLVLLLLLLLLLLL
jgi:hypothetical protein